MSNKETKFELFIQDLDSIEVQITGLKTALKASEENRLELEKQIVQLRNENQLYKSKYESLMDERISVKQDASKASLISDSDREENKQKLAEMITHLGDILNKIN